MKKQTVSAKKEIKENKLLDSAYTLFVHNGFSQTSIDDIVKKADVAQGTFYYYFKSKEAVLDEITDKYISIIVESMEKISKDENLNPIEKLVRIFHFSLFISF